MRWAGRPAVLKVTNERDELTGARALEHWGGHGAVTVLASSGNAVVLERAGRSLHTLSPDDDYDTETLCVVARRLHGHPTRQLDDFPTLRDWFSPLRDDTSPRLDQARAIADSLLKPGDPGVLLHGDLHQENILDGGDRGWLAIDPKGIVGPREFDFCNLFTNWTQKDATDLFDRRLRIVSRAAAIQPRDLLLWISAWSALSAIWHLDDGDSHLAAFPLSVMDLAIDRLSRT